MLTSLSKEDPWGGGPRREDRPYWRGLLEEAQALVRTPRRTLPQVRRNARALLVSYSTLSIPKLSLKQQYMAIVLPLVFGIFDYENNLLGKNVLFVPSSRGIIVLGPMKSSDIKKKIIITMSPSCPQDVTLAALRGDPSTGDQSSMTDRQSRVTIFVSSTFTDTQAERNMLMRGELTLCWFLNYSI